MPLNKREDAVHPLHNSVQLSVADAALNARQAIVMAYPR